MVQITQEELDAMDLVFVTYGLSQINDAMIDEDGQAALKLYEVLTKLGDSLRERVGEVSLDDQLMRICARNGIDVNAV